MDSSLGNFIALPDARRILHPRMKHFAGALRGAVNAWNGSLGHAQMVLDRSARATIINQYWYYLANIALSDDQGVIQNKDKLQRYFVIDERLILRFKLIDHNFESRNYPTKRAQQWRDQFGLPGLPPCERLELGYRLDITGTVIQDAFVLLRVGKGIVWMWQIWGERVDTFPIQFPLSPLNQTNPIVFVYDDYRSVPS